MKNKKETEAGMIAKKKATFNERVSFNFSYLIAKIADVVAKSKK